MRLLAIHNAFACNSRCACSPFTVRLLSFHNALAHHARASSQCACPRCTPCLCRTGSTNSGSGPSMASQTTAGLSQGVIPPFCSAYPSTGAIPGLSNDLAGRPSMPLLNLHLRQHMSSGAGSASMADRLDSARSAGQSAQLLYRTTSCTSIGCAPRLHSRPAYQSARLTGFVCIVAL